MLITIDFGDLKYFDLRDSDGTKKVKSSFLTFHIVPSDHVTPSSGDENTAGKEEFW